MKIAVVRLGAGPLLAPNAAGSFGGAEVRAVAFADGLARQSGHDVAMVVRRPHGAKDGWTQFVSGALGVVEYPLPDSNMHAADAIVGPRLKRRYQRLSQSLRKRMTRGPLPFARLSQIDADVICAFGVQNPTPSIVRAAREQGRKVMVFLTSDSDTQAALLGGEGRPRDLRDHRYAILNADFVVAQTEAQRQWVQRFGQAVTVVKNPIETQVEHLTRIEDRKYVLWVGRADNDCKRADLLIEIARACPCVPFVAVMNRTDEKTSNELYRSLPLNVELVEQIDFAESDRLYRDAIGLVNTSNSEGFPNAFLQAFKYGVPVLSRRVNPDGVLTVHQTGFVANDDLNQLAVMTRRLYEQPSRFASVAKSARNYVVQHHELSDRVDELDRALCELVHHRSDKVRSAA